MATFTFANRGFQEILDLYFRGATAPTQFLVALFNDTAAITDDKADLLNEQTGTGYAQQVINRDSTAAGWPTLAANGSGYMQVEGAEVTFTASAADWIATQCIALIADLATDRLIGYCNISSVTVGNGESLAFTPKMYLKQV